MILIYVWILTGCSWNGWGVRSHASVARAIAIGTERDFNRTGSQDVLGCEEDCAGPDVPIGASSAALRMVSGEVNARVEDQQGEDTWFEPQCRTTPKTTGLARLKRRSVCVRIIVRIITCSMSKYACTTRSIPCCYLEMWWQAFTSN